jgi:hypothetical protein
MARGPILPQPGNPVLPITTISPTAHANQTPFIQSAWRRAGWFRRDVLL